MRASSACFQTCFRHFAVVIQEPEPKMSFAWCDVFLMVELTNERFYSYNITKIQQCETLRHLYYDKWYKIFIRFYSIKNKIVNFVVNVGPI